jgi:hypothetical protein
MAAQRSGSIAAARAGNLALCKELMEDVPPKRRRLPSLRSPAPGPTKQAKARLRATVEALAASPVMRFRVHPTANIHIKRCMKEPH